MQNKTPNPFDILAKHIMATLPDSITGRIELLTALLCHVRKPSGVSDEVRRILFALQQHQKLQLEFSLPTK